MMIVARCVDAVIIMPLKKLPKLSHISFADNPVAATLPFFRLFVVNELPKLQFIDWEPITKDVLTSLTQHTHTHTQHTHTHTHTPAVACLSVIMRFSSVHFLFCAFFVCE
jgi:hypothetical protein